MKLHNRLEFDPEDPVTELLPRLMSGPYSYMPHFIDMRDRSLTTVTLSRAEENPAGILLKMRRYQREVLPHDVSSDYTLRPTLFPSAYTLFTFPVLRVWRG